MYKGFYHAHPDVSIGVNILEVRLHTAQVLAQLEERNPAEAKPNDIYVQTSRIIWFNT